MINLFWQCGKSDHTCWLFDIEMCVPLVGGADMIFCEAEASKKSTMPPPVPSSPTPFVAM